LLVTSISKLFQAVLMRRTFFTEIVRAWPAALYQPDLSDPDYKDVCKQLSRCAQWLAVIEKSW